MIKSKPRGLRRKCRQMVRLIEAETELFPARDLECDYWHLHLPVSQSFIDSRRTPFKVRRLCVQTLIERAHHLSRIAPGEDIRFVVALTLPQLWTSQIIVFFGSNYFDRFFQRNNHEQRWVLIEKTSLTNEWQLQLPADFQERGYDETVHEEELILKMRVWFFGNLI